MTTITAHGRTYELRQERYWHLTPRHGAYLLHNAYVGQGICWSTSAVRREPGLGQAITMYGAFGNVDKESAWERIRQVVDNNLPPRQHALFLFDDEAMVDHARQTWFPGQDRLLLEARIANGARVYRAESRWLDCHQPQWDENAARYWRGEMTANPFPEIVVDGPVYFPGWKQSPFGIGAGLLP
jgi:hypothetical protein